VTEFGDARLPLRFWDKVIVSPSGCWCWTAARVPTGYGQFWDGERLQLSHRVSFTVLTGPVPEGLQLDHLCRNRGCCNPAHLEPVTCSVNVLRGTGPRNNVARCKRITHCPKGHEYTPENTRVRGNWRGCWTCHRIQSRGGTYHRRRAREFEELRLLGFLSFDVEADIERLFRKLEKDES
jgi:hypothetical protein